MGTLISLGWSKLSDEPLDPIYILYPGKQQYDIHQQHMLDAYLPVVPQATKDYFYQILSGRVLCIDTVTQRFSERVEKGGLPVYPSKHLRPFIHHNLRLTEPEHPELYGEPIDFRSWVDYHTFNLETMGRAYFNGRDIYTNNLCIQPTYTMREQDIFTFYFGWIP